MNLMDKPDQCYFLSLAKELQPKRDMLARLCREVGLSPVVPQGGYFMMVNTAGLSKFLKPSRALIKNVGIEYLIGLCEKDVFLDISLSSFKLCTCISLHFIF